MKDFFTPRMIAYYLALLAIGCTGDLRAQWTPLHQAALEVTESYEAPKARVSHATHINGVMPVQQILNVPTNLPMVQSAVLWNPASTATAVLPGGYAVQPYPVHYYVWVPGVRDRQHQPSPLTD